MATSSVGTGGKKPIKCGKSSGGMNTDGSCREIYEDTNFNPGRTSTKRRFRKGHKPRTGKAAMRKATHHYGSFAKG